VSANPRAAHERVSPAINRRIDPISLKLYDAPAPRLVYARISLACAPA
jgi:hypothetical protein